MTQQRNKTRHVAHEKKERMNKGKEGGTKQEPIRNPCISRGVYAIKHTGFETQTGTHLTLPKPTQKKEMWDLPPHLTLLLPGSNAVSKNYLSPPPPDTPIPPFGKKGRRGTTRRGGKDRGLSYNVRYSMEPISRLTTSPPSDQGETPAAERKTRGPANDRRPPSRRDDQIRGEEVKKGRQAAYFFLPLSAALAPAAFLLTDLTTPTATV